MSRQLILSLFVSVILTACVTTRQEYNEQRGLEEGGVSAVSPAGDVESQDWNDDSDAVPATAGSNVAAGGYAVEELKAQVARLNGRVEELEHEKKLLEDTQQDEIRKLLIRIADLEQQLGKQSGGAASVPDGSDPFRLAKDAFSAKKYSEAIALFDAYIDANPNAKNTPEAYYYRGESNLKLKEYNKAIIDYSKFPEKYQKSKFYPKALLGIAESFDLSGRKGDARAFYLDLADKFPKTAEGKLAKKRLKKK